MRPEKTQTVALSRGFDSRHLHEPYEGLPSGRPSFVRLETSRREETSMIGWVGDIEHLTLENETFRTVLFTGAHAQLTVMRLAPGEDIGKEVHPDRDQFIRIEEGQARVEFGRDEDGVDESHDVSDDWAIVVPAGIWHNVINTGTGDLKLYSLYSPPEHPDGTVHRTRADAQAAEQAG
jgi:mannose-6-phosphate isomerase-like protein (cupin superfamily)